MSETSKRLFPPISTLVTMSLLCMVAFHVTKLVSESGYNVDWIPKFALSLMRAWVGLQFIGL